MDTLFQKVLVPDGVMVVIVVIVGNVTMIYKLIDPEANLNLNHNPNPKQSNLRFTSHHVKKVTIPFTRSIHRITEQIFRNFNITIRFAFTKNTISKILTITIRQSMRMENKMTPRLLYTADTKEPCCLVSMYWIKYNNAMYWYYSHTPVT